MGAWIETPNPQCDPTLYTVAPYVGAWIETRGNLIAKSIKLVAPYVGAWIETVSDPYTGESAMSHPTWVRGLKLFDIHA